MSEAKRVVTREENPVAYNCGCRYMGDEGRCFGCVAAIREAGIAEGRRMEREAIVAWLRGSAAKCLDQAEHGTEVLRQTRIDAGQAVYAHAACIERGEHEKGSAE